MTISHLTDPAAWQRRIDDMERESVMHLVCPVCEWIVVPVDGLAIDRLRRLVVHLHDVHPYEWRMLQAAIGAEDPFYALGDPE